MERLKFERDADGDFEHPSIPEGHLLRHHVLYRLKRCIAAKADPAGV
jgi:hypothetical protein